VTRVKVGDRIAGCFHARWYGGPIKPDYLTDRLGANLDGMLAEYAVLNEEALVRVLSPDRQGPGERWVMVVLEPGIAMIGCAAEPK
jgi:NADPH:quinone reductase-like Zn-dependent oxidoreductase